MNYWPGGNEQYWIPPGELRAACPYVFDDGTRCQEWAEFKIIWGAGAHEWRAACPMHVGDLLVKDVTNRVKRWGGVLIWT